MQAGQGKTGHGKTGQRPDPLSARRSVASRLLAYLRQKATRHGPYHEVVSLGRACQPAYQLRRVLGISRAHVFDWIATTDTGIRSLIADDLQGHFALDRLFRDDLGFVRERVTDTVFQHEFTQDDDIAAVHAITAPRITAMAERWRRLMASNATVLFIRQHAWSGSPADSAEALLSTLHAAGPRLRLRLLYLTEPHMTPVLPDRDDLMHRAMPLHPDGDWRGVNETWEERLREALSLDPPAKQAKRVPRCISAEPSP
jgi:hypothetical protein